MMQMNRPPRLRALAHRAQYAVFFLLIGACGQINSGHHVSTPATPSQAYVPPTRTAEQIPTQGFKKPSLGNHGDNHVFATSNSGRPRQSHKLQPRKRSQGAGDARHRQVSYTSVCEPADNAADSVPCDRLHVLSLAECIKAALDNNPATETSWQHSRAAAAGVGQADSAYLPEVDLTAVGARSDTVNLATDSESGAVDTYAADFSLRYLLFDGGGRRANLQGAEAALRQANFRHNTTLQEVALKVEEAYYRLLTARELERVATQTVRQTQYHLDVARARHKNGIVAKSDVLKAQTAKADGDLQLVRAKSQVQIIRGQLANAMGLPPASSFTVAELPPGPLSPTATDIEQLMAEAAVKRPELSADRADMAARQAKIKAAQSRYWPSISLNGNYGRRDRTFFPSHNEWSIGLGLSLPIFDGFNRQYTISQSRANLAAATSDYKVRRHDIELEVWTAWLQLNEATQAISAAKIMVNSAEESVRVTEGEYKSGSASIIDLIDAQTARTSANVQLARSRLAWYTGRAALERAVGRDLVRQDRFLPRREP